MKKIASFFLSLILIICIIFVSFYAYLFIQAKPISNDNVNSEDIRFEVHFGDSVKQTAVSLKEHNLIKNETLFYACARKPFIARFLGLSKPSNSTFILKSGIYYLNNSMDMVQILNELSSGKQEYITVSIPEGYTLSKIATLLEEKNICKADDFINICKVDCIFLFINDKFNISIGNKNGHIKDV